MASRSPAPVTGKAISPDTATRALLTSLALAEQYKRWGLFRELLQYIKEADGCFQYVAPYEYHLTYPQTP